MKKIYVAGCLFMLIGVILGALGAHALESYLTASQLDSFETGVRYQIYHALALLLLPQFHMISARAKTVSFYLFTTGTILFSISIYLLATKAIHGLDVSFLGPVTPVGGLLLISGWIYLLFKFISDKGVNNS